VANRPYRLHMFSNPCGAGREGGPQQSFSDDIPTMDGRWAYSHGGVNDFSVYKGC